MELLFLLGRILYGGYFVIAGVNHFTQNKALSGYAASKSVPAPRIATYGSGLFILFGGLSILVGVFIPYAVFLIAAFLLIVSFKMHAFWAVPDPMARMMDMTNFMKNTALLGAALVMLAIPEPWPFSLS